MRPRLHLLVLALALGCTHHAAHWSYEGATGPQHWGDLDPAYALARSGRQQSPIDLTAPKAAAVDELVIRYQPAPLKIVNNGHTIQVNCPPGSHVTIGGERFDLLQFHFHSPSEHTMSGKHHDLEMHLVHKNAAGQLAVIGVFLRSGSSNPALQRVWDHLPAKAGPEQTIAGVAVDASTLLPADRARYAYPGSLTTPPCSEGVRWIVLAAPVDIGAEQVHGFRAIHDGNNRPVQPLHGRELRSGK